MSVLKRLRSALSPTIGLCEAAADEIERLMQELGDAREKLSVMRGDLEIARREVDRLTRERDEARTYVRLKQDDWMKACMEVDRLRAALERLKLPEFDWQSSRFDRIEKILRGAAETKV